MTKQMVKYYVVWNGKIPGVYDSWDKCRQNVQGFPGAKFKSFASKARAEAEFRGEMLTPQIKHGGIFNGIQIALTVDGACSGSLGEFRGVLLPSKKEVFRYGPWEHATNNIMEYLAIVKGLRWIDTRGLRIPVYTDSNTALRWLTDIGECACRTTVSPPLDSTIADEIKRASHWINSCVHKSELINCIHKWDTTTLGEIPADFGRK